MLLQDTCVHRVLGLEGLWLWWLALICVQELREKQNQEIKMIEDRIQALNQEHFESKPHCTSVLGPD